MTAPRISTHVIIAVRGGATAKSRFGEVLSPDQRDRMVEAMLADMLTTLAACPSVVRVHVTTPTPTLARLAAEHGAAVVHENGRLGLNGAFSRARDQVAARAPRALVALLPGDLPLIERDEIEAVIAAAADGSVVLVPATQDGGTGAVVAPASKPMPLAFGPESFQKHVAATESLGLTARIITAPSLGFDMDRPEDMETLLRAERGGAATALLRQFVAEGETAL